MKKKIAIAVDGSLHAAQAVSYAASLAQSVPELHYVLMYIQPPVSTYLLDEAQHSASAAKELRAIVRKNQAAGKELLAKYQEQLHRAGIGEDRIEQKTRPRNVSVAEDLLAWSQADAYDALVVGRRGVSYLQELVMGSVTANLVNHSQLTPVWVVDGQIKTGKICLAVDGSPRSLRAVDHLAFMLSGTTESQVHMIHVQPRIQDYCAIDTAVDEKNEAETIILDSDQRCLDDFYSQALAVFKRYGFDQDRLVLQTVGGKLHTGKAILDCARKGAFSTIVMGKRGTSKSMFSGSVSQYVVQKVENMAVWIVP